MHVTEMNKTINKKYRLKNELNIYKNEKKNKKTEL